MLTIFRTTSMRLLGGDIQVFGRRDLQGSGRRGRIGCNSADVSPYSPTVPGLGVPGAM
jgi:hypothetical protein